MALGQAQTRRFPGGLTDGHTEGAEMRKQRIEHVRAGAGAQSDRGFVLARSIGGDHIDCMLVIELVDLILTVNNWHGPAEQIYK